ncbi:unnamed protein product [Moneuplotes crassus]|uniref:Uncharacterized protein n=1 Tax=Euplotes crassus TaxID=5936 RepID=A0AAD1Y2C2_EUPCR|nr:unnamed protein product [Moneuplotes crassus]
MNWNRKYDKTLVKKPGMISSRNLTENSESLSQKSKSESPCSDFKGCKFELFFTQNDAKNHLKLQLQKDRINVLKSQINSSGPKSSPAGRDTCRRRIYPDVLASYFTLI